VLQPPLLQKLFAPTATHIVAEPHETLVGVIPPAGV
jgi:hypothetical protein